MNLLEAVMSAGNGGAVRQMAQQFGLEEGAAKGAIEQLLPALAHGLSRNTSQAGGLESLLGALQSGGHARYFEDPTHAISEAGIADGNNILGHILGSKDASRNVAAHASAGSGVDSAILRKMLPVVASIAMGALAKQMMHGGDQAALQPGSHAGVGNSGLGLPNLGNLGAGGAGSMLGGLSSFLDADKDGSALDDVLNLAKKLF